MITRKLLNQFAADAVSYGPAMAVNNIISEWRFTTTPVMDNSAPSAYTDRAPLADDLGYAEFSDIYGHVLHGHPDNPLSYATSNRTEAGLLALRVFDREKHTSERDIAGFCDLFDKTTRAMVTLHGAHAPWMWVAVPWMREVLEVNMDIMRPSSFAQFVHEGASFNRRYLGTNQEYLDNRIFSNDPGLKFDDETTANQGLRALINNCFGLKRSDEISLSQAGENKAALMSLSKVLNELHQLKVTAPAYKKDLILTAELITLFSQASGRDQGESSAREMASAIASLVDMTMTPVKSVGQIRENRFRPGFTEKQVAYWSTTATANSLASALPRLIGRMPEDHAESIVQSAIDRFRLQVGKDAYQALANAIPHMLKKGGKPPAAAYFKIAAEVSRDAANPDVEASYLSNLETQEIADLISSLSDRKLKVRLMKRNPEVKGDVLSNELGL